MNAFDFGIWLVGAFVVFVVCGVALLFVLAWASDKWDSRHTGGEDEHAADLPPPWMRGRKRKSIAHVATRCPLCDYQHGHSIGCKNNPVDKAWAELSKANGGEA